MKSHIRQRLLMLVLPCSMIPLLLLGGIALYDMWKIHDDAVHAWEQIAHRANGQNEMPVCPHSAMEPLRHRIRFAAVGIGMATSILAVAGSLCHWKLLDRFVRPIHALERGAHAIREGNLQTHLAVRAGDELGSIAASLNFLSAELRGRIESLARVTAEKERIAMELDMARDIQASMLPCIFPPFPDRKEFDIFASMHPAKEVGGDFYDFYFIDDHRLAITIADVSGKGVPAALFMVVSKALIKNFAQSMGLGGDFAHVISRANEQLCQNNHEMMFVTVFFGVLDIRTGRLIYVNAGHNAPLVYRRAEESFSYIEVKKHCMLGIMEDMTFQQQEMRLEPGDLLFLYTDGVTESMNEQQEEYTPQRLQGLLNQIGGDAALAHLLDAVRHALDEHAQGAEQSDDVTMLVLRRNS